MNIATAISIIDHPLAIIWARWLAAIGVAEETRIFLTFDKEVDDNSLSEIHRILSRVAPVDLEIYFGDDPGYPGAANKMFIFTARRAAAAGQPFLWMESDMTPLRPGWMDEVIAEYQECGKPFMGPILHMYSSPHMNGTAVYPADWEAISNIAECPEYWPWDTFSRDTVGPQAFPSRTIRHTYGNQTFPQAKNQLEGCAVFHPCKDASLMRMLNETLHLVPDSTFDFEPEYIQLYGNQPHIHRLDPVKVRIYGLDLYVAKLDTLGKRLFAHRKTVFKRITKEEYQRLKSL